LPVVAKLDVTVVLLRLTTPPVATFSPPPLPSPSLPP
jgi:hypothetical protein